MRSLLSLTLAAGLVVALAACDAAGPEAVTAEAQGDNALVHRVSVGSPDAALDGDGPGDGRNFSANAQLRADGTVRGTHTDVVATGDGGSDNIHGTVDCLVVVDGNTAIWSGEITTGSLAGSGYFSAARDNGTSQQDPPDEISFTFIPTGITCDDPRLPAFIAANLFPIKGQVRVQ